MNKASGILLIRKSDGKVLTASRRNSFDRIGIPGGKVDPGETNIEACIREVFEETGIGLEVEEIELVYIRPCKGDVPYEMHVYFCYAEDISPRADFNEPFQKEAGIQIRWATWEELVAEHNPFSKYNTGLYEHMKSKLGNEQ